MNRFGTSISLSLPGVLVVAVLALGPALAIEAPKGDPPAQPPAGNTQGQDPATAQESPPDPKATDGAGTTTGSDTTPAAQAGGKAPQRAEPAAKQQAPASKKEPTAEERARAEQQAANEAAAAAEDAAAAARAPKRFIPTQRSEADSSATFPVDI